MFVGWRYSVSQHTCRVGVTDCTTLPKIIALMCGESNQLLNPVSSIAERSGCGSELVLVSGFAGYDMLQGLFIVAIIDAVGRDRAAGQLVVTASGVLA